MLRSVASRALRQVVRRSSPATFLTPHVRSFGALAGGSQVDAMVAANPNLDVVRYEHKNRVWTTRHVQYYSEALAIGLMEMGFESGDVVLSWMPAHWSEQMVLQFACSKAGLLLYTLDPSIATKDPSKATEALAAALTITKANILIAPETDSDVNYISLINQVVPELRVFDTSVGMPFVTPRFPHLRTAIHTGFDQDDKAGYYLLRHMVVPSQNLDSFVTTPPTGETPLAGEMKVGADGVPVGLAGVLTNAQVEEKNLWPTYCSILKKDFHEVEGMGVVF